MNFLLGILKLGFAGWAAFAPNLELPTGGPAAPPRAEFQTKDAEWAVEPVNDPLADREAPTLADLEAALANPTLRELVIERHFARVEAPREEQRAFLAKALGHESLHVRQQAAEQLRRLGLLDDVTADFLIELAKSDEIEVRHAALIAMQYIQTSPSSIPEHYWKAAVAGLASDDRLVQESVAQQFEQWGPAAAPQLMDAMQGDDPELRRRAARILARITATDPQSLEPMGSGGPNVKSFEMRAPQEYGGPRAIRAAEEQPPEKVRVYFGTHRAIVGEIADPRPRLWLLPLAFLAALGVLARRFRNRKSGPRSGPLTFVLVLSAAGVMYWSVTEWNRALRTYTSQHTGVQFGPRRDASGTIHHGYCDVTIPPTHVVGAVEQPLVGAEDAGAHVMLHKTELLKDQEFVAAVRQALAQAPSGARDCFVFVHGYNVTFDQAARRTAQIHYDLKFAGVPLFYSWPSRGGMLHYPSDRNEIFYSVVPIKAFLTEVAEKLDADHIHVIAHSMGAEGVTRAIAEMGESGKRFDQIILAAPDIDADVFRQQLAPRIVGQAQRTTLYCSRNDWALHASYAFNDSPRIGDSRRGIAVLKDIDTVDASQIDTDLLGHSYYGDCLPLLRDVDLIFKRRLPPPQRELDPNPAEEGLTYWTFRNLLTESAGELEKQQEAPPAAK